MATRSGDAYNSSFRLPPLAQKFGSTFAADRRCGAPARARLCGGKSREQFPIHRTPSGCDFQILRQDTPGGRPTRVIKSVQGSTESWRCSSSFSGARSCCGAYWACLTQPPRCRSSSNQFIASSSPLLVALIGYRCTVPLSTIQCVTIFCRCLRQRSARRRRCSADRLLADKYGAGMQACGGLHGASCLGIQAGRLLNCDNSPRSSHQV